MRCIVVGASMVMPTFELKYEDTWLFKIKEKYPNIEFIDKCRRASSVERLISEGQNSSGYDLLEFYNPDFVILHIGLTDVAPRLLKRNAFYTKIINHLPFSNIIYNCIRKIKGRTMSCSDLSTERFYFCLSRYVERAIKTSTPVFCIKLLHCGEKVLNRSPEMNRTIDIYNQLFDKLESVYPNVHLISPLKSIGTKERAEYMQSDGIHLSAKGSFQLFRELDSELQKYLKLQ